MTFGKFKVKKLATTHDIYFTRCHGLPKEKSFKCPVCSTLILQLSSFILHVGSHGTNFKQPTQRSIPKKAFRCDICSAHYPHKARLVAHMSDHIRYQANEFPCELCGFSFESQMMARNHLHAEHRKLKVKCRVCAENCVSLELRRLHELIMHYLKGLDCLKCKLRLSYKKVRRHFKQHTSSDNIAELIDLRVPATKCSYCEKLFKTPQQCRTHKLRIHLNRSGIRPKKILCEICGEHLSSSPALRRHIKCHSNTRKFFQCDICKRHIKSFQALETHIKRHIQPLECSDCRKTFMHEGTLATHMKSHESFTCSICTLTFKRVSLLKEHQKIHETKQHRCSVCSKLFSQVAGLNQHMKTHTVPSLICTVCNKVFKHPPTFYEHRKSHQQTIVYECLTCGKKCPSRFALYVHKKTHSSVRHECSDCGRQFKWKNSLKKHLLRKHNVPN